MDIQAYNRSVWDREVGQGNRWTVPVGADVIAAARQGRWEVLLTENKPVPADWFPALNGLEVLCLASGGGQQAPILAAAGATVTVLDISSKQLAQDRFVADRDGLDFTIVQGDMTDLSSFPDGSFDLVFNPCSNCFIPDVRPVWRESFRVLRSGGELLSGFMNPALYLFDPQLAEQNILQVKYALPYSDLTSLSELERQRYMRQGAPLEFGHTLTDQLGGQIAAGFVITGLYEDYQHSHPIGAYMPTYLATRAMKLPSKIGEDVQVS